MEETLQRAGLALVFVFFGLLIFWVWNRLQLARLGKPTRGLENFSIGTTGILYFTTPDCQPCKTLQRPALNHLKEQVDVQVIQVDAIQRPDLADYWGVLSVPTTFVIDSQGQPRGVNHGVASAEKLLRQLQAAESGHLALKQISNKARAELQTVVERKRS